MRKIMIWVLILALCATGSAFAEAVQKGKRVEIEDFCAFTINDVQAYDVFFNHKSGESKDFIAFSFTIQNLKTDQFFIKADTTASIVYEDDFEFSPDYLWAGPEGSYYQSENDKWIHIFGMDVNGNIFSNCEDSKGGFVQPSVLVPKEFWSLAKGDIDADALYDPQSGIFYFDTVSDQKVGPDSVHTYKSTDPSKTVLDPVVERTYHYVFLVPDMVAQDEGNRELIFTVDGEEYTLRF